MTGTIVAKARHLGFAIEAVAMVKEGSELFRVTYFDGDKVHTAEATVPEAEVRKNQSHEAFRAMVFAKAFEELALHLDNKAKGVAR